MNKKNYCKTKYINKRSFVLNFILNKNIKPNITSILFLGCIETQRQQGLK